jgi:hypothetical protein
MHHPKAHTVLPCDLHRASNEASIGAEDFSEHVYIVYGAVFHLLDGLARKRGKHLPLRRELAVPTEGFRKPANVRFRVRRWRKEVHVKRDVREVAGHCQVISIEPNAERLAADKDQIGRRGRDDPFDHRARHCHLLTSLVHQSSGQYSAKASLGQITVASRIHSVGMKCRSFALTLPRRTRS